MIPDKKCYRCSRLHIAARVLRDDSRFLVEKRPHIRSALACACSTRLAIDPSRTRESRRGFDRECVNGKMIFPKEKSSDLHGRSLLARARARHRGLVSSNLETHPGGSCPAERSRSRQPKTRFRRHARAHRPRPDAPRLHRAFGLPRGIVTAERRCPREQRARDQASAS